MVSAFRRSAGRRCEFSQTGVHDADGPLFSTTPASPIHNVDDGLISQGHVVVSVAKDSSTELQ